MFREGRVETFSTEEENMNGFAVWYVFLSLNQFFVVRMHLQILIKVNESK